MKGSGASGVEFIQVEESQRGALDAARRRVTPLVQVWASYPAIWGLDLFWLAVSCYMQGTVDGYEVAERHLRQEMPRA